MFERLSEQNRRERKLSAVSYRYASWQGEYPKRFPSSMYLGSNLQPLMFTQTLETFTDLASLPCSSMSMK